MKNLKKVLAMVLAFACTFSMFAGAKVFEDVPAGSDYSEAITMLSDLGVIQGKDDGKYHPEDTITRAEACAMIARLMTGDPKVSQYVGAQSFSDVQKGSWKDSAIGYCYINGIVIGVGNNKFEPDRAITDAEFVTMVVRAMGYETADMKQNYPFSYMSNAQAVGLLDGTNMVASTDALRGEDAQVIYNALFADYARGAKLVNTTHGTSVESYPTLAESVWGLSRAAVGEWKEDKETGKDYMSTCEAHTWVVTGNVVEIDKVNYIKAMPIEDGETELYNVKDGAYYFQYEGDVDSIKGYQVELWGQGDHSEPEYTTIENADGKVKGYIYSSDWNIKAIKTVKGQKAYDYNASMDDEKTNGSIETDSIDVDLDNVQNSKLSDKKIEEALNTKNSTKYKLIDWDSDGSVDYIDETTYEYYEVDSVSKNKVRLKGFDGKVVMTLDTDGETEDVKIDDKKYTVKAELPTDLKEGDIIEVSMKNVAAKKERISNWTVKVVTPETKDVTEVDTKKGVEFDDELIKVADEAYTFETDGEKASKTYDNMDEDSDETWDLWRDANGFIIKMQSSDSSNGYLFVTGYEEGTNKTGKRDLMVVSGVYGDNTEAKDVELVDNASIYLSDDKDEENVYDKKNHDLSIKDDGAASEIAGHAFRYTANDDGQITKLVRVATDKDADTYSFDEDTDVLKANDTKYYLDEAKVIFAVKSDKWTKGGALKNEEIDTDDVMAVEYKNVPSIGEKEDTKADDIQYDVDGNKELVKTAVLGVNSFRYFGNVDNKSGLITKMSYQNKADTYTFEATIAGMDETEFVTIDADDVELTGATSLDDMYKQLTKGKDAKHGLYAEFDFNADGKVIGVDLMKKIKDNTAAIEADDKQGVARAVVNSVSTKNRIVTSWAYSNGDGKLYTTDLQDSKVAYEITDDTKFYEVDADLEFPANGAMLNPYKDAFAKEFRLKDISEGDVKDLESFIRTEVEDDEYVVADVIYDDGDAVAVYYYKDTVAEAKVSDQIVMDKSVVNVTIDPTKSVDVTVPYVTVGTVGTVSAEVAPNGKGVTAAKDGNAIKVTVANTTQPGDYTVTVKDDAGVSTTFTVKVAADAANAVKLETVPSMPTLTALTAGSAEKVADIKIGNVADSTATVAVTKDGKDASSLLTAQNASGELKVTTKDTTPAGDYVITVSKDGYTAASITVTVDKATVALADSGSKIGNIKVSAKVDGKAIELDNTSALSVQVVKANTTDKVDVEGTWSFDKLWRLTPAADAGLVAGDTLYISLAEGANYNAAGPVVIKLAN